MIDRLMGALPSTSGGTSDFAWLLVWQSTLWLAVGLLAARVWRRRAGRAHLLLVLAMGAAFVSPLLTVIVHRMQWGFLPATPEPPPVVVTRADAPEPAAVHYPDKQVPREPAESPEEFAQSELESMPNRSTSAIEPEVNASEPPARARPLDAATIAAAGEPLTAPVTWTSRFTALLPALLAAAWSIASFLLLVRLAISLLAGTRIVRTSRQETNPQLVAALGDATRALGMPAAPGLRASTHIRCPMIWCWGARPVVLLPTSANDAGPILWRSVFCHELAHAIRRDHWTALWAEIVIIALPWQPLAWLSRRRLAYLREQACDDWVLSTGGEATDYADSLLQLVPQGSPSHALAAVSSRESLKQRLEHILAGVRITPKVGRRWVFAASLFSLAAIAGVGFAQQGRRAPVVGPEAATVPEIATETPLRASKASQLAAPPNPASALPPGVVVLRGRVLLPNGQPAIGATVRAIKSVFRSNLFGQPPDSKTVLATFTADSQGDFGGKVDAGGLKEGGNKLDLWATLPGFGLALHAIDSAEKTEPIVMSLADEEPIRGRIIDLEGRPVRDARVEVVQYIDTTSASIDKWLATILGKEAEYRHAVLPTKPMAWVPAALIAPLKTNSEGRFVLKGIGRDRQVYLRISGPRVALTGTYVITRPLKPIPQRYFQIFGSQFERAVSPSVSLEGFVTDEESGKPIPGVRVETSTWDLSPTTTDDRGHYRFDSLTPGSRFGFYLRVLNQPYFSGIQGFPIPVGVSLEPIRKDFKLKRGVWAIGRAYDRMTGKPVSGTVFYNPYLSNEFARKFASNNPAFWEAMYDCGRADAEGRIRAVVIPGRGVISLQCETGDYRFNFGLVQIKEINDAIKARRASPLYNPFWSERDQAVREINVAPGASETTIDLPVDPGQNVVLRFVDAAGNRLAGVDTYGLRSADARKVPGRDKSFAEGDSAILYATYPEETRTIWLRHRSSGLAKLFQFTAKEEEKERTIILEPPAVATGRVVTSEGTPLSEIEVQCDVGGDSNKSFPPALTDAQGHFRRDLPPGGPITVSFAGVRLPELTVVGGEQIDFGEIAIERDAKQPWKSKVHRGPAKRAKGATAEPASAAASSPLAGASQGDPKKPATPVPTTRELHGRVLLPNGQPAAGATVRLVRSKYGWNESPYDEVKVLAKLTSGPQGEFRLNTDSAVEKELGHNVQLWTSLPGYGAALHSLDSNNETDSLVLRLAEELPIRGRIIDLEGRPVRDARVEAVRYIDTTTAAVDAWLASAAGMEKPVTIHTDRLIGGATLDSLDLPRRRRDAAILHVNSIEVVSEAVFPRAKTDSDGRFEFKGIGRDRIVVLQVSAPHSTTIFPISLTRTLKSNPFPPGEIFGSEFERIVPPSALIEGVVTDEESGKPVPGAVMNPHLWHQALGLAGNFAIALPATADAAGHYRLEGVDRLSTNRITVTAADLPYFGGSAQVPVAKGLEPTQIDVKLKRGVWASGRAYDQVTGKPVDGHVIYSPSSSNKLRRGFSVRSMRGAQVDGDGHFRVLVLPGRGMVYLSCKGDYRFNAGAKEIRDARGFSEVGINRFCEIDVPTDATEAHVDLAADPGQNVVLKFTDAAGKPLVGIDAYGLRYTQPRSELGYARTFSGGHTAILYAVSPEDVRRVWFRHRASGLNKMFRFKQKPGETERTIVLDPPAIVTGRFVTPEGKPISGLSVSCLFNSRGGPGGIRGFEDVSCDAQGRFRRDLPAGDWITLMAAPEGTLYLSGALIARSMTVAAGEQIDFGDITIEPDPKHPGLINARHGKEKRTKPTESTTAMIASTSAARAPQKSAPSPLPVKSDTSTTRELHGRVLLPNGQLAVGASVRVMTPAGSPFFYPQGEGKLLATFSTDAQGMFAGKFSTPLGKNGELLTRSWGPTRKRPRGQGNQFDFNLWATLPGYGLALVPLDSGEPNKPFDIRLAEEEPIRGHMLDLEGRPIRDAKVELLRYFQTTTSDVDQFIASALAAQVEFRNTITLPNQAVEFVPSSLCSPLKTDSAGRFELRGVGRDRQVELRVTAPKMAAASIYLLTRPIKPISMRFHELLGSQFERVVPPSVPVEGIVIDAETGKPIPGAQLTQFGTRGINGIWSYLSATTDARGHYRIEGLETNSFNELTVRVSNSPYFSRTRVEISPTKTLEPIREDIKLRRGIWAVGRAYDRTTGKPVSGRIEYVPFESNEFQKRFRDEFFGGPIQNSYTDVDGHFRAVVMPGRGALCLLCGTGDYRFDLGRSEIKNKEELRLRPGTYHAIREINAASNVGEVAVDLPVEPGQNVVLKFTDAAGKPLVGIDTHGLRFPGGRMLMEYGQSFVEGDSAILYATYPGENRHVWLKHRASGLSKLVDFVAKAGETEQTIALEPPAVVIGRLVSEDGSPLARAPIRIENRDLDWDRSLGLTTDVAGRFRVELPAGGPFEVKFGAYVRLADKLTVAAGEQVDLGDITIEQNKQRAFRAKVQRGPEKRTKPQPNIKTVAASKPAGPSPALAASKAESPKPTATTRALRGRVLLPNGQPAVGAAVRVTRARMDRLETELSVLASCAASANGDFATDLDAAVFNDRRPISISAALPRYGLAARPLAAISNAEPIVLQLAAEESIRGRVVDLEGRPVHGARVEVLRYFETTTDSIDQWLAAVSKLPRPVDAYVDVGGVSTVVSAPAGVYLHVGEPQFVSETLISTVQTDSDGRFELRGLGRDRLVGMRISASGTATAFATVLTRPIEPILLRGDQINGSQLTCLVSPSVPVEGFITDEDNGTPIAGLTVFPYHRSDIERWAVYLGVPVHTTTDARGHYRLEGLNTQQVNICGVQTHDLPYLDPWYVNPRISGAGFEVPAAAALRPIRCDVKLKRGIWAVGRAYDRSTGKPVKGLVRYTPFRSNDIARKYHVNYGTDGPIDTDGHFRVLVVPGRGVLTLYCEEGDYRLGLGREDIADFEKLSSDPYAPFQTVREINVPPNAPEAHADLDADPGRNVVLKFTDAAGKPLAGVEADGLRLVRYVRGKGYSSQPWRSFVAGDSATLYATFPGETRTVLLKHRASGLTKLFRFTPKDGETERTIVLEPPAVITARFLTPEGTPLEGWSITCTPAYNMSDGLPTVSSDAKGRLRAEVPAGLFTSVTTSAGRQLEKNLKIAAGEQIDLGDVTVEFDARPRRAPKITHGPLKRINPGLADASAKPSPQADVYLVSAAAEKKPAVPTATTRELRGRVLLPNGQPAGGATITLIRANWQPSETEWSTVATLRADSRGEFRGDVDVPSAKALRGEFNLWATLAGYGLAFRPFPLRAKSDAIVMNLVEDEPIRGHLIDVDGRPLRDARVQPVTLRDSTAAWVDEFIASAKDKPLYLSWVYPDRPGDDEGPSRDRAVFRVKASASIPVSLIPAVKAGPDGRFEITGLGRDRHVDLKISGPRVVTTVDSVVTRPIKPIPFEFREVYGSQFERVAAPSVPISGTVVDEESGKPVAGVTIRPFARAQGRTIILANEPTTTATTDAQGHFRLEGLNTGTENQIRVVVAGLPYLETGALSVAASIGLKPIELEIKLHRAVWVTGRAYDRATGLPVKGTVYYTPFRSNEFAKRYGARRSFVWPYGIVEADGHFRVPAVPGRGVVFLECNGNDYRFDLGKSEIKELAETSKRPLGADSPTLLPLQGLRYQRLCEVNVAPNTREVHVDLPVERGTNIFLKFTDAAGKPLAGVDAQGLHGARARGLSSTDTDTAPLRATFPGERRPLWLRHRTSGLTKLFDFVAKPGETERTIVLEKPAVVIGQLLSEEGTPLSRLRIECDQPVRFPSAITDREGRFRFELPGGGPFTLRARLTQLSSDVFPAVALIKDLKVMAGETIELGRTTIEPPAKGQMLLNVRRGSEKRTPAQLTPAAKDAK